MAQRRRGLRILVIVLGVLVVLAVAADRIGVAVAEHLIATKIQHSQNLSSEPDVDIEGFPFLTQVAENHFDQIDVSAANLTVGDGTHDLTISSLHTTLHDVTTAQNFHTVHVQAVTATAQVSLTQLGQAIGQQLSDAGNGRVALTKTVPIAGVTFSGTASSLPVLRDDALVFTDIRLEKLGSTVAEFTQELLKPLAVQISFAGLPFGLRADALSVANGSVSVTFTGHEVTLSQGGL